MTGNISFQHQKFIFHNNSAATLGGQTNRFCRLCFRSFELCANQSDIQYHIQGNILFHIPSLSVHQFDFSFSAKVIEVFILVAPKICLWCRLRECMCLILSISESSSSRRFRYSVFQTLFEKTGEEIRHIELF